MHIGEFLREAKCCIRCLHRLSGKHNRANFVLRRADDAEHANVKHGAELLQNCQPVLQEEHKSESCPLCLGILGDNFLSSCLNKIAKKMLEDGYDSDTFSLNAMIPNSIAIRQHSLYTYAKEKLRDEVWKQEDVVSVKDALKYGLTEKLEEKTRKKCDVKSDLRVTVVADYINDRKEVSALMQCSKGSNSRKRKYGGKPSQSISSIQTTLDEMKSVETLSKYADCPPQLPTESCSLKDILCFQEAIYVAGRYNKYSRELSQTPWIIDGTRKTESSVQELICDKILQYFRATDLKFISAGREDVDVKMLGSGRPFAIELINSRRTKTSEEDVKELQISINSSTDMIAVNRLQMIPKKDLTLLKEGEEHKIKLYRATVYAKNGVSDEKLESLQNDLVISQKTPVRVLHRRPFAARSKTIHSISAERIDQNHFALNLSTQAGTYIKEFVHGDFRRTCPSLGSLLETEVDILELDVQEVELVWPPAKEEEERIF
ncbi:tRNA pseudouridine synthase Pus10-like isoform X2 [Rhopilema esculentum]|uniref:tRNA pseudouridine synthase Pus10-like isoform X2 n=1 Tax=Rhopilema esculentum TaxID=499914 RepID=UPI0031E35DC7